ncbi:cytidine and deoxycytidylate deaminase [Paramecium bursaria Chlorella virus NY2B]|uniref:Cytidine and deoxycytidylate deaminase n=1 Tax=Paramecium bursaria Chlorella virus NYs1 TaxID=83442 RepID=M1I352_9PHYC|nr:cytidine and deoxycytidylate deaminase [Paramecium bursaria Chlorella virus NYs1]AGE54171.1 cytidine and deoxycytidylate deaminase [Paramecium bursaria Chlorella virus IL-5-2s1]AGE54816.1 cytidine and deoxycytidylate deaminase [Paramecium bursaria Chlorella virus MA1D]AGE58293.1 cytidine and deoxycytidylate deaminase [Paramecium bursaria Chlorella virus NY2B]AGE58667.1 cytidine and deoxycytidylate deaminase [Paramecium bursaria Chlorella virus NYs1]
MTRLDEAVSIAINQANRSTGNFRHGCVILSGKKIIAEGHNHMRRDIGTFSVHAEMDGLWKIYDSDLYDNLKAVVIRITTTGKLANSRPCEMCMAALRQHKIETIVYSTACGRLKMEKIK